MANVRVHSVYQDLSVFYIKKITHVFCVNPGNLNIFFLLFALVVIFFHFFVYFVYDLIINIYNIKNLHFSQLKFYLILYYESFPYPVVPFTLKLK